MGVDELVRKANRAPALCFVDRVVVVLLHSLAALLQVPGIHRKRKACMVNTCL